MNRHFEYIDSEGKHWSGVQELAHLPREDMATVIRSGNRLLAILARGKGWKPFPGEVSGGKPVYVHTWHPDFPFSERMKRINLVQVKNGNAPLHDADAIADADKPGFDITIAQFDKDGNVVPSMVIPPLGRTPIPPGPGVSDLATRMITIEEHPATEGVPSAPVSAEPAAVTIPEPAVPTGTQAKPEPIESAAR